MMRSRCGRPQVIKTNPLFGQVAAISVGLVEGRLMLDLDYEEDSNAEIDMNVVMNAKGGACRDSGHWRAGELLARPFERVLGCG